jgi:hypothetical protein
VHVCVLSPRWRHLWATLGSLKLDTEGFTTERKFTDFVTSLLLHRDSAPLESCSVRAAGPAIFLTRFQNIANI